MHFGLESCNVVRMLLRMAHIRSPCCVSATYLPGICCVSRIFCKKAPHYHSFLASHLAFKIISLSQLCFICLSFCLISFLFPIVQTCPNLSSSKRLFPRKATTSGNVTHQLQWQEQDGKDNERLIPLKVSTQVSV